MLSILKKNWCDVSRFLTTKLNVDVDNYYITRKYVFSGAYHLVFYYTELDMIETMINTNMTKIIIIQQPL